MSIKHIARWIARWYIAVTIMAIMAVAHSAVAAQIWFGPRQPSSHGSGEVDFYSLFEPHSPWAKARAATRVFILEPSFINHASNAELRKIGAYLKSHHILIDVDVQSVAKLEEEACGGIEGYAWPLEVRAFAKRLYRLGLSISYIHLDGPLWFGHYDTDVRGCRLPLDQLIRRVAINVKEVLQYFPQVKIVDVEGIPALVNQDGWRREFRRFVAGIDRATGRQLAALQLDVDWDNPQWRSAMLKVASFLPKLKMKLGVIYNGTNNNQSDSSWIHAAERHIIDVESDLNLVPSEAVFASWDEYPARALPEWSSTSHTHLIKYYLRRRVGIRARLTTGDRIAGRLYLSPGMPIRDHRVFLYRSGIDFHAPLPLRTITGVVPKGASQAIVGIRINKECRCRGNNDVFIGSLDFKESGANSPREHIDLSKVIQKEVRFWPFASLATVGETEVGHIRIPSTKSFLYNSPPFRVIPGRRFILSSSIASALPQGMFGAIVLIWLGHPRSAMPRSNIIDRTNWVLIDTAMTDSNGKFHFPPLRPGVHQRRIFRVVSDGNGKYRRAVFTLR